MLAYMTFGGDTGVYTFISARFSKEQGLIVRTGVLTVADFLRQREGEVAFDPTFDDRLMVPRGQPLPPRCGKPGYNDGLQIDVVVQGFGLATFTSTAGCVCRPIEAMYDAFCFAPEAQRGQLPVYAIEPSRRWQSKKHGKTIYDLVWSLKGWTDRSSLFRPALIAVTKPIAFESQPRAIPTDVAFNNMTVSGEVEEPPQRWLHL
jgi:hypothetical protein